MDEHSQHKKQTKKPPGIWRLNAYVENQANFKRIYLNAPRNIAGKYWTPINIIILENSQRKMTEESTKLSLTDAWKYN